MENEIKSIHFKVRKWQYNKNAVMIKLHTDCQLLTHPLRKQNETEAQGLCFLWYLTITANDIEVLYYNTEEFFVIPNKKISLSKLKEIIYSSYLRSQAEIAFRNLAVGLDAGLPKFEDIPMDLERTRNVLDM